MKRMPPFLATNGPGDFPPGSMESRAAARRLLEKTSEPKMAVYVEFLGHKMKGWR